MKTLRYFFLILVSACFLATTASAADFSVDCGPSGCTKTGLDPLFSTTDGVWYPGRTVPKSVNVANSQSSAQLFALKGTRTTGANSLENVFNLTITNGATTIWSGTLFDFYNLERIDLGTFNPGTNKDYLVAVAMDSAADNSTQNLQTVFDLTLGIWTTAVGGTSSGGGGSSGVGNVTTPTCSDVTPGSAPVLSLSNVGVNTVTLNWTAVSPVTYYTLSFTRDRDSAAYGSPDVGNVTTYTVTNLSGGDTYTFEIFAVNGCQPGDRSNKVSSGLVSGEFTPGRPFGPNGETLGTTAEETTASASSTPEPSASGTVESTQSNFGQTSSNPSPQKLPWVLLGLELGVLLVAMMFLAQDFPQVYVAVTIITSLVSIVLYVLLRDGNQLSLIVYSILAILEPLGLRLISWLRSSRS